MRPLPLLFCVLLLTACGKKDEPTKKSYTNLPESLEDAEHEAARVLGPDGDKARAVWDQVPGADAWTNQVIAELGAHQFELERAKDLEDFCPDYNTATYFQKKTCWIRIISAMARYESNLRPNATFLEATGSTSVGLLMMNPAHCAAAPSVEQLKDPVANVRCGTQRLELLISKDPWISGAKNRGGASYWSVLREPYQRNGHYLGRKPHIKIFTRTYRAFPEPIDSGN